MARSAGCSARNWNERATPRPTWSPGRTTPRPWPRTWSSGPRAIARSSEGSGLPSEPAPFDSVRRALRAAQGGEADRVGGPLPGAVHRDHARGDVHLVRVAVVQGFPGGGGNVEAPVVGEVPPEPHRL